MMKLQSRKHLMDLQIFPLQLAGTAIRISIGYPLDTDTPGFANENLSKVRPLLLLQTRGMRLRNIKYA